MPTLWAHQVYFNNSSTAVTPALAPSKGGYPLWQASNFAVGFGLGGAITFWERAVDAVAWGWRLGRLTRRFSPEQRAILTKTIRALQHPAYPVAQAAVRQTAVTLGFNRPEAWKELSREMKGSARNAENTYRHLHACRVVRGTQLSSTLTTPQCHLIVELAYHGFAAKGQ